MRQKLLELPMWHSYLCPLQPKMLLLVPTGDYELVDILRVSESVSCKSHLLCRPDFEWVPSQVSRSV